MPDRPPEDAPRPETPADAAQPDAAQPTGPRQKTHAGGFTLDLSKADASADDAIPRPKKRKGPAPLVQKTFNLSTKPAEKPQPEAPARPAPRSARPKPGGKGKSDGPSKPSGKGTGRDRRERSGGTSLADLLDPDTLAKLRGR